MMASEVLFGNCVSTLDDSGRRKHESAVWHENKELEFGAESLMPSERHVGSC
jgi:hypothetical protein